MDYTVVIEKGEDGILVGSVVELPGCYTQAHTIDTLITNIKEAIKVYLEGEENTRNMEFIGIQKVTV